LTALSLNDRIEACLVGGAAAASLEHRTLLYGKRHVMNVAFNMGRGLQANGLAADDAGDSAADDHVLRSDHTGDFALLSDDHLRALHVAFDFSIDLQEAATDNLEPLADNPEIIANDRFLAA
jgi:hypothetical protein